MFNYDLLAMILTVVGISFIIFILIFFYHLAEKKMFCVKKVTPATK